MNGTKTVTVLFDDEEACEARWLRKGYRPISRTYHSEADPSDANKTLTFATLVFARMAKQT